MAAWSRDARSFCEILNEPHKKGGAALADTKKGLSDRRGEKGTRIGICFSTANDKEEGRKVKKGRNDK